MRADCCAQRLLNPFRGTVHTIKYASAEAVTLDGIHWDIYVANDELLRGRASLPSPSGFGESPMAAAPAWLEREARQQAVRVSQLYRLYPEIIDEDGLKALLVEAILRRAQERPANRDTAQGLATFYLELKDNPCPTD